MDNQGRITRADNWVDNWADNWADIWVDNWEDKENNVNEKKTCHLKEKICKLYKVASFLKKKLKCFLFFTKI